MGTALTAEQIARAWRVVYAPVLLMDGDPAGRKAAVRACETALPGIGPGGTLSIAILPDGVDPDDLLRRPVEEGCAREGLDAVLRSEEHTSELQSLMRISYAVFCLKKKKINKYFTNSKSHNKYNNKLIQSL